LIEYLGMEKEKKNSQLLGILGGMGPEAGLEFARILIEKTPATRDQEHMPFVLLNWPQVPDRTAFLLGKGPDPVPSMLEGIEKLKGAGASRIALPCNTAHAFLGRLRNRTSVFVYDMLETAATWVARKIPEGEKIGLIATLGTLSSGLYPKYFEKYEILMPSAGEQERIHHAIYRRIKSGSLESAQRELLMVAENLHRRGARAVILGCTEVEMALRKTHFKIPWIKPMEILAEQILKDFDFL